MLEESLTSLVRNEFFIVHCKPKYNKCKRNYKDDRILEEHIHFF